MPFGWTKPYSDAQEELIKEIRVAASAFNRAERKWVDQGLFRLSIEHCFTSLTSVTELEEPLNLLTQALWHEMKARELELEHITRVAEQVGGSL